MLVYMLDEIRLDTYAYLNFLQFITCNLRLHEGCMYCGQVLLAEETGKLRL
jgi:hypothetical protein